MSFFKYSDPIDRSIIEEAFARILARYRLELSIAEKERLFARLRNIGPQPAASPSPFPLLNSMESAHRHVRQLRETVDAADGAGLHTCRQVLASFYGFDGWESFTSAVERFSRKRREGKLDEQALGPAPPEYHAAALEEFSLLGSSMELPQHQFARLSENRSGLMLLQHLCEVASSGLPAPDWEGFYHGWTSDLLIRALSTIDDNAWDNWLAFLGSLSAEGVPGPMPATDAATRTAHKDPFSMLINAPNQRRLARFPWIAAIPGASRIIANGEIARKKAIASELADPGHPGLLLHGRGRLSIDGRERTIRSWIMLRHAFQQITFQELDLMQGWQLSAYVAWDHPSPTENPFLALCKGHYFTPFKGDDFVGNEDFFCLMDAESPAFNIIAQVVLQKIMARMGYCDFEDMASDFGEEAGVLVLNPELHPSCRKKGLLAPVLDFIMDTITCAPRTLMLDSLPEQSVPGATEPENIVTCRLGTPGALLFPVSGTPVTMMQGELADSGPCSENGVWRAQKRGKVADLKAESRKFKLRKHFSALQFDAPRLIEVYDPNDYL